MQMRERERRRRRRRKMFGRGGLFGGVLKGVEEVTKAGAGVVGGVVEGTGKAIDTAGKAGAGVVGDVVGGAGKVVGGKTGEIIQEAGSVGAGIVDGVVGGTGGAIEDVGETIAGKKKEKKSLKDVFLHDEPDDIEDAVEEFLNDDFPKEDSVLAHKLKDMLEEGKHFDRLIVESDDGWDEADKKLGKQEEEEGAVRESDDGLDEAEKKLGKLEKEEGAVLESDDDGEDEEEEMLIPRHFSLKSKQNKKYLRYTYEHDYEDSKGLVKFTGDRVVSPYSKFEVRASKTDRTLVHIRCCYNNRFLVRLSTNSNYIAAVANEEEEDQSIWSCTLFEPIFQPDENAYRFRHVLSDSFLRIAVSAPKPYTNCLVVNADDNTDATSDGIASVVDWDAIFILPRHVAFKGNNDQYLRPSGVYLQFSASSAEDPSAVFEIVGSNDGFIRIKHVESGKYWIRDPDWIHCKSIDTEKDDPNTLFWPVKVETNIVALRNMGNNCFCKRLTADRKTSCLNAAVSTIADTARLEVTEIVVARTIENVEYHLDDARIYGKKVLTMSKGFAINKTEVADKITMKFRYQKMKETSWSTSVSLKLGLTSTFSSSIPDLGGAKVQLSLELSNDNEFGGSEKEASIEEKTEIITVPPMSKVKLGGIITQASCDIPFSYTQRDTLKSGSQISRRLKDGIFTGVTTMDYKFDTQKLPL